MTPPDVLHEIPRRIAVFSAPFAALDPAHEGRTRGVARDRVSATGRLVRHRIDATFVFRNGLAVRHIDPLDVWRRETREQAGARLAAWRTQGA